MAIYIPPPRVTPTVAEQHYLCLINRDRADPAGAFDRLIAEATPGTQAALVYFGVSLSALEAQLAAYAPVAPLAWNGALATSARTHSALIVEYDEQSHNLPGEPGLYQRITEAGYADARALAENVYAYSEGPLHGHAAFVIDWGLGPHGMQSPAGHRVAILSPTYTEVGIGILGDSDPGTEVGPEVVTQHFGTTWSHEPQFLGTVIEDLDGDGAYDPGEGLGGVTVTATTEGMSYVTTSWASGGYQMALPPGDYTVTYSGGGLDGTVVGALRIGTENAALDVTGDMASALGVTLSGTGGTDGLSGSDSPDLLLGRGGSDLLEGQGGGDVIEGGTGHDSLFGGAGDDHLSGAGGLDALDGGDGADTLLGQSGNDALTGGSGADLLQGGQGADSLSGGPGADQLEGGDGSDLLSGQDGDDRLNGQAGADTLSGGSGRDLLQGGINRDSLAGGEGRDRLEGGNGWDSLSGGEGDDTLLGQAGEDRLDGGAGDDLLHGGIGADVFVFTSGAGQDEIVHYQPGIDAVEIDAALAPQGLAALEHQVTEGDLTLTFAGGEILVFDGIADFATIEGDLTLV
ncbi:CAP domain-containing protein [Roseivivax sp.]